MPVYANFFYIPRKKELLVSREQILAWVGFLTEQNLISFDTGARMPGRRKADGLFTRIKRTILGDTPTKPGETQPAPPPEPAIYFDPTRLDPIPITSRESISERPELADIGLPFLKIDLPYLTKSFGEQKIKGRGDFERGWTLTRSIEPFPLLDAYKSVQCMCRKCKETFDPRDYLVGLSSVCCPGCTEESLIAKTKMTPILPMYRTVIGLEQSKVVDPEEDDPEKNGLKLSEYTEDFQRIFNVPFDYQVVYT